MLEDQDTDYNPEERQILELKFPVDIVYPAPSSADLAKWLEKPGKLTPAGERIAEENWRTIKEIARQDPEKAFVATRDLIKLFRKKRMPDELRQGFEKYFNEKVSRLTTEEFLESSKASNSPWGEALDVLTERYHAHNPTWPVDNLREMIASRVSEIKKRLQLQYKIKQKSLVQELQSQKNLGVIFAKRIKVGDSPEDIESQISSNPEVLNQDIDEDEAKLGQTLDRTREKIKRKIARTVAALGITFSALFGPIETTQANQNFDSSPELRARVITQGPPPETESKYKMEIGEEKDRKENFVRGQIDFASDEEVRVAIPGISIANEQFEDEFSFIPVPSTSRWNDMTQSEMRMLWDKTIPGSGGAYVLQGQYGNLIIGLHTGYAPGGRPLELESLRQFIEGGGSQPLKDHQEVAERLENLVGTEFEMEQNGQFQTFQVEGALHFYDPDQVAEIVSSPDRLEEVAIESLQENNPGLAIKIEEGEIVILLFCGWGLSSPVEERYMAFITPTENILAENKHKRLPAENDLNVNYLEYRDYIYSDRDSEYGSAFADSSIYKPNDIPAIREVLAQGRVRDMLEEVIESTESNTKPEEIDIIIGGGLDQYMQIIRMGSTGTTPMGVDRNGNVYFRTVSFYSRLFHANNISEDLVAEEFLQVYQYNAIAELYNSGYLRDSMGISTPEQLMHEMTEGNLRAFLELVQQKQKYDHRVYGNSYFFEIDGNIINEHGATESVVTVNNSFHALMDKIESATGKRYTPAELFSPSNLIEVNEAVRQEEYGSNLFSLVGILRRNNDGDTLHIRSR